jgi:site-specific DNA-adenine methylase
MTGYFGSKAASGLYQNIIAMMPPHDTFIETHLGGGVVMQKKPPAQNNIAIDIDPKPLKAFSCDYPVQKINGCAHLYLSEYDYTGFELIYCDPPYLIETRTSKRRYRHEYTRQDHINLLELLKSLPCRVILSGYRSTLYDDLLAGWNRLELQAMTWGGPRTEKLWYNYDMDRTHWATYAGKDFTDRQRIKRKAGRWAKNYQALPPAERLALLAAIMAVEAAGTD